MTIAAVETIKTLTQPWPKLSDLPPDHPVHGTVAGTPVGQANGNNPHTPRQKKQVLPRRFLSPELAPPHLWPANATAWGFTETYPSFEVPQAPLAATAHPRGYLKPEGEMARAGSAYPAFLYSHPKLACPKWPAPTLFFFWSIDPVTLRATTGQCWNCFRTKGKKGGCGVIGYTVSTEAPLDPVEPPRRAPRRRKVRNGVKADPDELESEEDDSGSVERVAKRPKAFWTPEQQRQISLSLSPDSDDEIPIITPEGSSTEPPLHPHGQGGLKGMQARLARLERDNASLERQLVLQAARYEATIEGMKAEWALERSRWKAAAEE